MPSGDDRRNEIVSGISGNSVGGDVDDCAINRQEVLRIRRRGLVRNEDVCLE